MDRPPAVAREVRLAAGGPPPRDWEALSTPQLQLRWISALAYANRTTAVAPSEEAAAAITALVELLDRRGALLPEIGSGPREARLAAAGERLHITGTIAHAAGMPAALRQLTREDAAATVRTVADDRLDVAELLAAGATTWTQAELERLLEDARRVRTNSGTGTVTDDTGAERPVAPGERIREPASSIAGAPNGEGSTATGGGVVDISLPHRAGPDPAAPRPTLAPDSGTG